MALYIGVRTLQNISVYIQNYVENSPTMKQALGDSGE